MNLITWSSIVFYAMVSSNDYFSDVGRCFLQNKYLIYMVFSLFFVNFMVLIGGPQWLKERYILMNVILVALIHLHIILLIVQNKSN